MSMTPHDIQIHLEILNDFEDMGHTSCLASTLAHIASDIRSFGSEDDVSELVRLEARLGEMKEYEEQHGAGSLLKHDHPLMVQHREFEASPGIPALSII